MLGTYHFVFSKKASKKMNIHIFVITLSTVPEDPVAEQVVNIWAWTDSKVW